MGKRGNILLHVLVTGVVVALMAACLLRVAMLRYEVAAHARAQTQARRDDDGALAYVMAGWAGTVCNGAPAGYSCSGSCGGGTCNCTLTQASSGLKVVASPSGTACALTITSSDPMANLLAH